MEKSSIKTLKGHCGGINTTDTVKGHRGGIVITNIVKEHCVSECSVIPYISFINIQMCSTMDLSSGTKEGSKKRHVLSSFPHIESSPHLLFTCSPLEM